MPFQLGAPDIIFLVIAIAIPVTIVWVLYRVTRMAVRAGMRDAMSDRDRHP